MSQASTESKITQFIHQYSKPELFEEIPLLVSKAFKEADVDCRARILNCSTRQNRKRSQDRYFYTQEALCSAASGWKPSTQLTDNKGESYTQLETKNLLATLHVLPWFDGKIRRAKSRDKNAALNEGIAEQLELLLEEESKSKKQKAFEKLNILIVAVAPQPDQQQDEPAQIQVYVPHESNKGYHLKINIDDLIAGFATAQPITETEDQAWPKLRKQMRKSEEEGSQGEQNE
ncbi:hypothetical protein [Marinospirillum sp.]|uniref:hypothetical protein n=1 Tax=Marinospirillum sp. TaxID=2183934 RepID=UPI00384C03D4